MNLYNICKYILRLYRIRYRFNDVNENFIYFSFDEIELLFV